MSNNCIRRWNEHKDRAKHPREECDKRSPIYLAIRKYGLENFSFSIIEECRQEELKDREIYWIEYYHTFENGYNATRGGDLPEGHVLKGEKHGMSKLTEKDVIRCRRLYSQGARCLDIWRKDYKDVIHARGFQRMWHGKTWKHIMPEVFNYNPHPRQHVTQEDIDTIREMGKTMKIKDIQKTYKKKIGYGTVWSIIHHADRFSDK